MMRARKAVADDELMEPLKEHIFMNRDRLYEKCVQADEKNVGKLPCITFANALYDVMPKGTLSRIEAEALFESYLGEDCVDFWDKSLDYLAFIVRFRVEVKIPERGTTLLLHCVRLHAMIAAIYDGDRGPFRQIFRLPKEKKFAGIGSASMKEDLKQAVLEEKIDAAVYDRKLRSWMNKDGPMPHCNLNLADIDLFFKVFGQGHQGLINIINFRQRIRVIDIFDPANKVDYRFLLGEGGASFQARTSRLAVGSPAPESLDLDAD